MVPTSMTTAPSLTMSAVMKRGLPMATMRMSAMRMMSSNLSVREFTTVTVASTPSPFCIMMLARGLPTMLLRPTITTCLPLVAIP